MSSYAIMTNVGRNKEAAALAGGAALQITEIAWGDGDRSPGGGELALLSELGRKPVQANGLVPNTVNTAFFEILLDATEGPFVIREAGLLDADGDLIAIAKYDPPVNKPKDSVTALIRINVVFSDLENLILTVQSTDAFVPVERRISAGVGLSGGGDMSVDRSLGVAFATTAEALAGVRADRVMSPALVKATQNSPALTGSPTAPTPAQFNATTGLATTEFVQRALGNFSGVVAYNVDTVLGVADVGRVVIGTGSANLTLPLGANVVNGAAVFVERTTFGSTSVIAPNGELIFLPNNQSLPSINLAQGDTAHFVRHAGSWRLVSGSLALRYHPAFQALGAASGYQRLPSGLIIQWGAYQGTTTATTVTFPVTFPTAAFSVVATCDYEPGTTFPGYASVGNVTATGFTSASNDTLSVRYVAVGM